MRYAVEYGRYFDRNADGVQVKLHPAPNWAVWPGRGVVSFGSTFVEAGIIADIARHTARTVQAAEALGGWRALPEKDIFDIEYWELEQAKLGRSRGWSPALAGKVALVTGAAAGIGFQCARVLHEQGACVAGFDINPEIEAALNGDDQLGLVVDLTAAEATSRAVESVVRRFGGLDVLVSNAGIFTAGAFIDELDDANWARSLELNLTSHMRLLRTCIPFLKRGIDATAIVIGSRNVRAPGAGAASYSCAKAGLTQLVRVAALELAPHNVRVNVVHPDAVFDTKLWTPEALKRSAERYGITVEEYKKTKPDEMRDHQSRCRSHRGRPRWSRIFQDHRRPDSRRRRKRPDDLKRCGVTILVAARRVITIHQRQAGSSPYERAGAASALSRVLRSNLAAFRRLPVASGCE